MVCDVQDYFFGPRVGCQHHQSHEFKHRFHHYFFQMQSIRGRPSFLKYAFIIISHYLFNILKLLLIFQGSATQKSHLEWLQYKLLVSYCIDANGKINLPVIDGFLGAQISLMVDI